jgi:general secretion pathway protein I
MKGVPEMKILGINQVNRCVVRCRAQYAKPRQLHGFTLVEVVVALGITALALMAGIKTAASLSRSVERQPTNTYAQICADNALIALHLRQQIPGEGRSVTECVQAGKVLQVEVTVLRTTDPDIWQVQARVLDQGNFVREASTIIAREP